jgi:hypothetical protein
MKWVRLKRECRRKIEVMPTAPEAARLQSRKQYETEHASLPLALCANAKTPDKGFN